MQKLDTSCNMQIEYFCVNLNFELTMQLLEEMGVQRSFPPSPRLLCLMYKGAVSILFSAHMC